MKFEALTSELSAAISVVLMAVKTTSTTPVLESILFDASEVGKVKLTGTDESLMVSVEIAAAVQEFGKATVRGKLIDEMLKKITPGRITISTNDQNVFVLQAEQIKTRIAGGDADVFPIMVNSEEQRSFSIEREVLLDMISGVEVCVARDDMRQVLTGAYLEVDAQNVCMVGLDGYRMAVYKAQNANSDVFDLKAIIPKKALGVFKKALSSSKEEYVNLMFGKNVLSFALGDTQMQTKLIEGEYIQWKTIVPKSYATEVTINGDALRKAVERASVIARMQDKRLVRFGIRKDQLRVTAESSDGVYDEELDAETKGADLNISFNISYVADMVKFINGQENKLHFNNAVSPCVAHPDGNPDYFWLILPVRTGAPAQEG